jgi:3-hydroxybutyryl-CoA dehydrogenase
MHVGVVGVGVIGAGVAQCLAQAGMEVTVVDLTRDILDRARAGIRNQQRLHALLGGAKSDAGAAVREIEYTTDMTSLRHTDFVIENVTEKWATKLEVYARLDRDCGADCVFAANTSAIPITRIASITSRPDRVIGAHFMNPVPLKGTVEVIRGFHTSQRTLDITLEMLRTMGKDCVVVDDAPGFVSNRVLMLMINEAVALVSERVASADEIDRIFKSCCGHAMGPLATADLIGLDTVLHSIEVLQEYFGDRFAPALLLRTLVAAGLCGRKSGRGFFEYGGAGGACRRERIEP